MPSRRFAAAAAAVAVVIAAVLLSQVQHRQQALVAPTAEPPTGSATGPTATSGPTRGSTPPPLPTKTPSPNPRSLEGRTLGVGWLTGYLTRPTRSDDGWVAAIRDITTPELLAQLKAEGSDAVGLFRLKSWQVSAVKPLQYPDLPAKTPSRVVLAYLATVTDGTTQVRKPFVLYSYREPGGRWLIAIVEQPYSSEG